MTVSRPRRDRGSALLLFPVGLVIVLLLGAVVVDFSAAHLARRDLADAASAAANDAVTSGLDLAALHADGGYRLDPHRVDDAVRASLQRRSVPDLTEVAVTVDGAQVQVRLARRVDLPLGTAMTVTATGTADARTAAR